MLMAATSIQDKPQRNFHITFPPQATYSDHLLGQFPIIGPRRIEIRQRLAGFRITNEKFEEYCNHTRFHWRYIKHTSDLIGKWETFKIEKVNFPSMTSNGNKTQCVMSRPIHNEEGQNWLKRVVQNTSVEDENTATMCAAFVFRFQLYKVTNRGETRLALNQNWCCVTS